MSSVLSFGVGYDVNSRLLDRISRMMGWIVELCPTDEDIEGMSAPFMPIWFCCF